MNHKEFDIVVHGATGFTGRPVVAYLLRQYPAGSGVRWALAIDARRTTNCSASRRVPSSTMREAISTRMAAVTACGTRPSQLPSSSTTSSNVIE